MSMSASRCGCGVAQFGDAPVGEQATGRRRLAAAARLPACSQVCRRASRRLDARARVADAVQVIARGVVEGLRRCAVRAGTRSCRSRAAARAGRATGRVRARPACCAARRVRFRAQRCSVQDVGVDHGGGIRRRRWPGVYATGRRCCATCHAGRQRFRTVRPAATACAAATNRLASSGGRRPKPSRACALRKRCCDQLRERPLAAHARAEARCRSPCRRASAGSGSSRARRARGSAARSHSRHISLSSCGRRSST